MRCPARPLRVLIVAALAAVPSASLAQSDLRPSPAAPPPFTSTLSNTTPLAFGMSAADAAIALGTPLTYLSGKPGHEIYVAQREFGGGFFGRDDRLFLQFRGDRLTGWRGQWDSRKWPIQ
jgi:hypothetical protein